MEERERERERERAPVRSVVRKSLALSDSSSSYRCFIYRDNRAIRRESRQKMFKTMAQSNRRRVRVRSRCVLTRGK